MKNEKSIRVGFFEMFFGGMSPFGGGMRQRRKEKHVQDIRFTLNDKGGTDYGGVEVSPIYQREVYVRQKSDKPEDFSVNYRPHEYAIDSTTFYIDSTEVEYFRLPYQDFAPDVQTPEKMRFSWERNDSLDVDTYATTNLDTLFETYYRLEMTTDSSEYT